MLVRPMAPGDLPSVAALVRQLSGEVAPLPELSRRLERIAADPRHSLHVAEDSGRVAAWMHLHEKLLVAWEPCLEVVGLVVDQDCRGKGVGKRMMDFAEKRARERGFRRLFLRSQIKRADAHRFYEKLGYAKLKTQHVFEKRVQGD